MWCLLKYMLLYLGGIKKSVVNNKLCARAIAFENKALKVLQESPASCQHNVSS